jgi:integrase
VLWKRTLDALKKIPSEHANVFVLSSGKSTTDGKAKARGPIHTETLARHFAAARARAGIKRNITFANLRDSALTAAAESTDPAVPVQQYHVLAGHVSKGVDDSYISRNPRFVETACRAIERRYFSK